MAVVGTACPGRGQRLRFRLKGFATSLFRMRLQFCGCLLVSHPGANQAWPCGDQAASEWDRVAVGPSPMDQALRVCGVWTPLESQGAEFAFGASCSWVPPPSGSERACSGPSWLKKDPQFPEPPLRLQVPMAAWEEETPPRWFSQFQKGRRVSPLAGGWGGWQWVLPLGLLPAPDSLLLEGVGKNTGKRAPTPGFLGWRGAWPQSS